MTVAGLNLLISPPCIMFPSESFALPVVDHNVRVGIERGPLTAAAFVNGAFRDGRSCSVAGFTLRCYAQATRAAIGSQAAQARPHAEPVLMEA